MESSLRNYTTIPPHLYVHRTADYQLKKIINEMDRPGYVLVARQMGKTNLLFNAKREIESESIIFGYVDLSNSFTEERDCYRNIIDCIVEPNENFFLEIIDEINTQRQNTILPPHKEHLKELRLLLNHFSGKIIIILDEIDALKNAAYSDHVFAQIRSNYFARTNYPELNNLTYILSGVIEPTELIKDKNKSPFNIGEKIYLEDFTLEEFKKFLILSNLKLDEENIEYLYSWTNGNPRLTFDLCVEISNYLSKNLSITSSEIEEIIEKKYLTSFDIAPIDHIRELVKENTDIRKAVKKIYQNNTADIDDELKQKLYLYGIISYGKDSRSIKLKNQILQRALSVNWLDSIDTKNASLFEYGIELITHSKDYYNGINKLKEYLSSSSKISESTKALTNYYIGFAYNKLEDFATSNDYLLLHPIKFDSSPDLHFRQKLFIGLNFVALDDSDEGIRYLEEIIANYKKGAPYANALLNLSSTLMNVDFEKNHERALKLLDELIDLTSVLTIDEEEESISIKAFSTLAYYNKAEIFFKLKNQNELLKALNDAISIGEPVFRPVLKLFLYNNDSPNQNHLLQEIANDVISHDLEFVTRNAHGLSFTKGKLHQILVTLLENDQKDEYDKLIDYYRKALLKSEIGKNELIYEISQFTSNLGVVKTLLLPIINESNIDKSLLLKMLRRVTNVSHKSNEFISNFIKYKDAFIHSSDNIESADITVFSFAIKTYSDNDKYSEAIEAINAIEPKLNGLTEELLIESSIIYYWAANVYFQKNNKGEVLKYSNKTLGILDENPTVHSSIIDEEGINSIKKSMISLRSYSSRIPVIASKKYGRNDKVTVRYIDGLVIEGKYKRFEQDIELKKCLVVQ